MTALPPGDELGQHPRLLIQRSQDPAVWRALKMAGKDSIITRMMEGKPVTLIDRVRAGWVVEQAESHTK